MVALVFFLIEIPCAWANPGHEVAERHARRVGDRLEKLQSLRAEGRTLIGDQVLEFKLWSRRPNQLRVESGSGARKVVQIFDGRHAPVITHTDAEAGRPLRMTMAEAKDFVANADFDGPLVNFAAKQLTVDYAGEETVRGIPAKKLLLMTAHDDVFFLWLDASSHEIIKRGVFRLMNGKRTLVETYFSDFREVGGVPQPHRIETVMEGKVLYLMVIARMWANDSAVTDETFAVPEGWPTWKLK